MLWLARPLRAHRDDRIVAPEFESLDGHPDAEHLRLERHIEIGVDDREPPGRLLRLVVRVDRCLLINITNYGGSFGVSLYTSATHATQMAASGCGP